MAEVQRQSYRVAANMKEFVGEKAVRIAEVCGLKQGIFRRRNVVQSSTPDGSRTCIMLDLAPV